MNVTYVAARNTRPGKSQRPRRVSEDRSLLCMRSAGRAEPPGAGPLDGPGAPSAALRTRMLFAASAFSFVFVRNIVNVRYHGRRQSYSRMSRQQGVHRTCGTNTTRAGCHTGPRTALALALLTGHTFAATRRQRSWYTQHRELVYTAAAAAAAAKSVKRRKVTTPRSASGTFLSARDKQHARACVCVCADGASCCAALHGRRRSTGLKPRLHFIFLLRVAADHGARGVHTAMPQGAPCRVPLRSESAFGVHARDWKRAAAALNTSTYKHTCELLSEHSMPGGMAVRLRPWGTMRALS